MSQHSRAIGLLFALTSIVALAIVLSMLSAITAAHSTPVRLAPAVPSTMSAQVVLSPTATGGFGSPNTHTTVAAFQIDGQIVNNQHTPIFNATISAQPSALNSATSDGQGHYALYFVNSGAYTLTVNRYGFGVLPPRYNLTLNNTQTGFDFVLPPQNDILSNGGWEAGDFTGWQVDPTISATIELTAAHTGWYGLHLDAPLTGAEFMPSLTQTFTVAAMSPTLSFMYQVTHGNGDPFVVAIMTDTSAITHSFVVTPGNWTHEWIDLSACASQTVTLTLGFQNPAAAQQIYLDEISLGDAQVGVYPVFLPTIRHN